VKQVHFTFKSVKSHNLQKYRWQMFRSVTRGEWKGKGDYKMNGFGEIKGLGIEGLNRGELSNSLQFWILRWEHLQLERE